MPEQKKEPRFGAVERYVITLMAAALHERRADPKPSDASWEQIYQLTVRHSIQSLTFPALSEDMLDGMPHDIAARWRNEADMSLFQQVSYDVDREAILADFAKAGLSWIPLKGIIVTRYYPQPGMRSMSDQDLLIGYVESDAHGGWTARGETGKQRKHWRDKAQDVAGRIMFDHGYHTIPDGSFAKTPLHFELHRTLISAAEMSYGAHETEINHYANPWRLVQQVKNSQNEFVLMSDEEYIFHLEHMLKHYRNSGFGLRFLADQYLYCVKFAEVVNSPRTHDKLAALGLTDFERDVRELSIALMDQPDSWDRLVSADGLSLFEDVLAGGTYGSFEHRFSQALKRQGERKSLFRYWRGRLFPSKAWVEEYFPQWSRNALTRTMLVFYRMFRGVIKYPQRTWEEIKTTVHAWSFHSRR